MTQPRGLTDDQIRMIRELGAGGDAAFLREVRRFSHIGYGRMMQIIEREWFRAAQERGDPTSGVLVVDTCLGLMTQADQDDWRSGYRADPLRDMDSGTDNSR